MMKAIVLLSVVVAAFAAEDLKPSAVTGFGYNHPYDTTPYGHGYEPSVFGNRFGKQVGFDDRYDNYYGASPYGPSAAYPGYQHPGYPRGRSMDYRTPADYLGHPAAAYGGYNGYNNAPHY